jgi:catechol 2,3-dioxygenase-like lactoylglutathione lyase family enzyme
MKILGIAWIGLVSDHPEIRTFYKRLFDLKAKEETPNYMYFIINEMTHLEILPTKSKMATRQKAGVPAIGFLVDDLNEAVKELEEFSVSKKSGIEEWKSETSVHRWIYFSDPEGHTLLLLERRNLNPARTRKRHSFYWDRHYHF